MNEIKTTHTLVREEGKSIDRKALAAGDIVKVFKKQLADGSYVRTSKNKPANGTLVMITRIGLDAIFDDYFSSVYLVSENVYITGYIVVMKDGEFTRLRDNHYSTYRVDINPDVYEYVLVSDGHFRTKPKLEPEPEPAPQSNCCNCCKCCR